MCNTCCDLRGMHVTPVIIDSNYYILYIWLPWRHVIYCQMEVNTWIKYCSVVYLVKSLYLLREVIQQRDGTDFIHYLPWPPFQPHLGWSRPWLTAQTQASGWHSGGRGRRGSDSKERDTQPWRRTRRASWNAIQMWKIVCINWHEATTMKISVCLWKHKHTQTNAAFFFFIFQLISNYI